ncbi:MAG: hypothetical protein ACK2U9_10545 [Anaerolineae bacterium]
MGVASTCYQAHHVIDVRNATLGQILAMPTGQPLALGVLTWRSGKRSAAAWSP